ncbi:MAG: hypothetical protein ACK4LQ_12255 [Pararhodobacter sp.]
MEILFFFLLVALMPFLLVAALPPGRAPLVGMALLALLILAFAYWGVPERGSSDAAGRGLELGYHSAMVWTALLGTAAGGLAQLLRHLQPGLTGRRYALAALGALLGVMLAALALILLRP